MLCLRHSLNIIRRPTRPLPSWKGWMDSKRTWKSRISSKVILDLELYSLSRALIASATSAGFVVSLPPTSAVAHYIFKHLVITDFKPGFLTVRSSGFQNEMKLLYKTFCKFRISTFNYQIYTTEVIYCFNNIINLYSLICNSKSFCFKDITGLVMGKLWAFNMIWIISKVNLNFMINSAFKTGILFAFEKCKKCFFCRRMTRFTIWLFCGWWNLPGFPF